MELNQKQIFLYNSTIVQQGLIFITRKHFTVNRTTIFHSLKKKNNPQCQTVVVLKKISMSYCVGVDL